MFHKTRTEITPAGYRILLAAAAWTPAIVLFCVIWKYWVNIPFWDQWNISCIFDEYFARTLTFSDFIAQANESRLLFPRLIVLGMGLLTGWDVRFEMCITFLFAVIISVNFFILLNRFKNLNKIEKFLLIFIINLFLFSPIQWENWLWGIQLIVFIPPLMLSAGLIVNTSQLSMPGKVLCNAVLSTISTFSYANGMVVWFLLTPIYKIYKNRSNNLKNKYRNFIYIFIYILAGTFIIFIYFSNYKKPFHHPSFLIAFSKPADALLYFLYWISGAIIPVNSPWGPDVRVVTGLFILSLFFFSLFYFLFNKNKFNLIYFYPWIIIGAYALISGSITTLGRIGFGTLQATSSRYAAFSIFLPISIFALLYLIYLSYFYIKSTYRHIFLALFMIILCFSCIFNFYSYKYSLEAIFGKNLQLRNGKFALQYHELYNNKKDIEHLYIDSDFVVDRAKKLRSNGLLDFKFINPHEIRFMDPPGMKNGIPLGHLDVCELRDDRLMVSGWARHPEKGIPARVVIFSYTSSKGETHPLGFLQVDKRRPDVEKAFTAPAMSTCGFSGTIDMSHVPEKNVVIRGWVFCDNTYGAYRLANSCSLNLLPNHHQRLTDSVSK